jgi:hypothetical protein
MELDLKYSAISKKKSPTNYTLVGDSYYNDYSISETLNVFTIPLLTIGIAARFISISPF